MRITRIRWNRTGLKVRELTAGKGVADWEWNELVEQFRGEVC